MLFRLLWLTLKTEYYWLIAISASVWNPELLKKHMISAIKNLFHYESWCWSLQISCSLFSDSAGLIYTTSAMGKACHSLKRDLQNLSWSLSKLVMFSISLSSLQIPNVFKSHHNSAEQTINVLLKIHFPEFILSVFSHLLWEQAVSFQWQGMGKKSCT